MSTRVSSASPEPLSPAVVNFIRLHLLDFGDDELTRLQGRLEEACLCDPGLAMASDEDPQKTTDFRDEVLYLSLLIDVKLGKIAPTRCADFPNWIRSIEGTPVDDDDVHVKIRQVLPGLDGFTDTRAAKLATGRLLARLAFDRICDTYSTTVDRNIDETPCRRLLTILTKASESCVFSKIGNQYLFQYFRAKLSPERCALLVLEDTPFREVAEQFDDECNDITRPVIDTLVGDQFSAVDWHATRSPFDFILAASVLREIVDAPIGLLVNTEVTFSEVDDDPKLYAMTPDFAPADGPFGVIQKKALWWLDSPNAVMGVLYQFLLRQAKSLPDTSFAQIVQCCECQPEQIPRVNPFRKYVY